MARPRRWRAPPAAEGLAWGVVNHVAPAETLLAEVLAVAGRIASNAPLAVKAIKRSIDHGDGRSLQDGMAIELELYNRLFPTRDRLEGVRAFNEKRKPDFRGE